MYDYMYCDICKSGEQAIYMHVMYMYYYMYTCRYWGGGEGSIGGFWCKCVHTTHADTGVEGRGALEEFWSAVILPRNIHTKILVCM